MRVASKQIEKVALQKIKSIPRGVRKENQNTR